MSQKDISELYKQIAILQGQFTSFGTNMESMQGELSEMRKALNAIQVNPQTSTERPLIPNDAVRKVLTALAMFITALLTYLASTING